MDSKKTFVKSKGVDFLSAKPTVTQPHRTVRDLTPISQALKVKMK